MKKLGLSTGQQIQSVDIDKYLKLFEVGLSSEQVQLIKELFGDQVPTTVEEVA
jgi:hypothetical protein